MHKRFLAIAATCLLWSQTTVWANNNAGPTKAAQHAVSASVASVASGEPLSPAVGMSTKKYVVQLGAFTDEFQAVYWRQKLSEMNIKTFILPAEHNNGVMRIRTGPFDSKQAAQDMVQQLKQQGIDGAMVLPEASNP